MIMNYTSCYFAPDRDEVILRACRGKRVVHIGACDSPYTMQKMSDGLLLHARLLDVASDVVGVDVDREAIQILEQQGIRDIVHADCREPTEIMGSADVVVLGETIEHVGDPGELILQMKLTMRPDALLIISTPNLYSLSFQLMVLRGSESFHDDHVVGFSMGLLVRLLRSCGFSATETVFTFLPRNSVSRRQMIWRKLGRLRPGWAETLLVIAKASA